MRYHAESVGSGLDWSASGNPDLGEYWEACSAPVPWVAQDACTRHDFAARNMRRLLSDSPDIPDSARDSVRDYYDHLVHREVKEMTDSYFVSEVIALPLTEGPEARAVLLAFEYINTELIYFGAASGACDGAWSEIWDRPPVPYCGAVVPDSDYGVDRGVARQMLCANLALC